MVFGGGGDGSGSFSRRGLLLGGAAMGGVLATGSSSYGCEAIESQPRVGLGNEIYLCSKFVAEGDCIRTVENKGRNEYHPTDTIALVFERKKGLGGGKVALDFLDSEKRVIPGFSYCHELPWRFVDKYVYNDKVGSVRNLGSDGLYFGRVTFNGSVQGEIPFAVSETLTPHNFVLRIPIVF